MSPWALLPLLLALEGGGVPGGPGGVAKPVWRQEPGEQLPAIRLERLGGGAVSLPPIGRISVLNVFATWCSPCRLEMPRLDCEIRERYASEGVDVYGIDRGEGAPLVRRFADWIGVGYPILLDPEKRFFAAISADGAGIPKTLLLDREGRVVHRENGFRPGQTIEELSAAIEGLLAGAPSPPPPDGAVVPKTFDP